MALRLGGAQQRDHAEGQAVVARVGQALLDLVDDGVDLGRVDLGGGAALVAVLDVHGLDRLEPVGAVLADRDEADAVGLVGDPVGEADDLRHAPAVLDEGDVAAVAHVGLVEEAALGVLPGRLVPVVGQVLVGEVAQLLLVDADRRGRDLLVVADDDDLGGQVLQEGGFEPGLGGLVDDDDVEHVLVDARAARRSGRSA